jgi:hypothetical protein
MNGPFPIIVAGWTDETGEMRPGKSGLSVAVGLLKPE